MPLTLSAALLTMSCGSPPPAAPPQRTATGTTAASSPIPPAPPAPTSRTEAWFNLQVGDCVRDIPAVDEGEVDATLVRCTEPHRAEVYQRAPIPVDAASTDIANERCAAALTAYTGHPSAGSPYTVTYLIDSNQDRTADNPLPSTVICLLQAAGDGPLTGPARR